MLGCLVHAGRTAYHIDGASITGSLGAPAVFLSC
jgi:hypothetical protein